MCILRFHTIFNGVWCTHQLLWLSLGVVLYTILSCSDLDLIFLAKHLHPTGGGADVFLFNIIKKHVRLTENCVSRTRPTRSNLIENIKPWREHDRVASTPIYYKMNFNSKVVFFHIFIATETGWLCTALHTHISCSFMVEGYHCIKLPYPKIMWIWKMIK